MASDSLEFLGDPYCNVWPLDLIETADSSECITFSIKITAKFTSPWCNSDGEEEEDDELSLFTGAEGRSIKFSRTFTPPLAALMGGEARDNVAKMLSDVHVPATRRFIVDKIIDTARVMANEKPEGRRVIGMNVVVDAFVEELPVPSEDDDYVEDDGDSAMEIDDDSDDDDYVVRLVPASKESIEGLQKVRVELSEKSETCSVCLDDFSVGSEAIRLPCSHIYHGDCIVKWLQNSKFCPLCRSEISN